MSEWQFKDTNTHQEHVIAHVVGTTIQAYFVWDETAYLLLDIGFIWNIYLDGEMGLVPHPMAINELQADDELKRLLRDDIDRVNQNGDPLSLQKMKMSTVDSPIQTVEFFEARTSRRLLLTCEEGVLVVETSLETSEVNIYEL